MEQNDFTPFDEAAKVAQWKIQFYDEIIDKLTTDKEILEFYEDFVDYSINSFIWLYASSKVHWHAYGEENVRKAQAIKDDWKIRAMNCLAMIQQKKLFDLQCEWRANKVTIPEIEISYEFTAWSKSIFDCPFLPPITESDMNMMRQYLQETPLDFTYDAYPFRQEYDEIKNDAQQLPPIYKNSWYHHHNQCTDNDLLILVYPDLRGAKEKYYIDLAQKERFSTEAVSFTANVAEEAPSLPLLEFDEETMLDFAKRFDDKVFYTRCLERRHWYAPYKTEKMTQVEKELELLMRTDTLIPIESHEDWTEGIRRAAERLRREIVLEHLPEAFTNYKEYLENHNLDLIGVCNERHEYKDFIVDFKNLILRGRALNGESIDFNY